MLKYLDEVNPKEKNEFLNELREYAEKFEIPIVTLDGINLINQLIKISKAKRILEIGTAIGYSSINMATNNDCNVVTIERNEEMYIKAYDNIKRANKEDKIEIIYKDALFVDETSIGEFDIIFIDAAKAQYIKFFEKYKNNLKQGGIIISDNLLFHGRITEIDVNRNFRQLMRKLRKYNEFLTNNDEFNSYIYNVGDGMAISIKK